ncbi:MAG: M13 family metallopeptidase [Thermoplasmata archaeon]|nr:M13 family metallopeptidase [Thermoplasmata archaeon]
MAKVTSEEARVPRFSVEYMDQSVDPSQDFYSYATGNWRRNNPVPADKSIWGAGAELIQRNYVLLRDILDTAAADANAVGAQRQVGDFYASALDHAGREALGFAPIQPFLGQIRSISALSEIPRLLAGLHDTGAPGLFETFVYPDRKNSSVYAFYLYQGGLGLPDREYYLSENFTPQREGYHRHLARMFHLLGEPQPSAETFAAAVVSIETALAQASRSATDLRDEVKNHNPFPVEEFVGSHPGFGWAEYLTERKAGRAGYVVVGQPEFFSSIDSILSAHSLADWKVYLSWHVLHANAPFLHEAAEMEHFDFFRRTLQGQAEPEPRWKRAALTLDAVLGEAMGELYVREHFPAAARARMALLVSDLQQVFRDRLKGLDWMSSATRERALVKFDRFTAKIGHPDRFRDYSSVIVRRGEYAANRQRATEFEVRRRLSRLGGPVDSTEWEMTPQTVNAYCNQSLNEIVFPAGILQPPFFDVTMDDAVNYGGIGAVIGHEITHGYDDQGRRFDADGNLVDWWTETDAREFDARAKVVVAEYAHLEGLPGLPVNGELTLGENIADFGGVSIAYEALQRRLAADPARRTVIDGLTAEQRFFVSWAQIWRQNCQEPERRRRLTIDPHSPGEFRAVVPVANMPEFTTAFPPKNGGLAAGTPRVQVRIW